MMTEIIIMALLSWLVGFLGQKSSKGDYKIDTESNLSLFLGIRPGTQPVFIRPAILQIVAILMIIIWVIMTWLFPEIPSTKDIVFKFMIFGYGGGALLIGLVDLWFSRR